MSGEQIRQRREQWFFQQRAYPLGFIPAGARLQALEQLDRMIAIQSQRYKEGAARPRSAAASSSAWTLIGPKPTSRGLGWKTSGWTSAMAVDPRNVDVVYLGSPGGGVWKTTDAGVNWVPLTDSQPSMTIGSIALAPSNPDIVYVGTGDFLYGAGILKSTNAGKTWTNLPGPFTGPFGSDSFFGGGAKIWSLAVHSRNPDIVLAGVFRWPLDLGGIYRSTDGGVSWKLILSGGAGTTVFFDPVNEDVAYSAIGEYYSDEKNGVYKSTDAGKSWTSINGTGSKTLSLNGSSAIYLAQAASNPDTMYVAITGTKGLFKTSDAGITWARIAMPPLTRGIRVLAVHPADPQMVFAGAEFLYRSLDGGMNWKSIQTGANGKFLFGDIRSYAFSSGGDRLYVGDDGGPWSTSDPASQSPNWANLSETLAITLFYPGLSIHPSDINIGFGGTQDQGVQKYTGSLTWDAVYGCDGGWTAIDPSNPSTVFATCQGILILKSTQNGDYNTWSKAQSGIDTTDRVSFIPPFVIDLSNSKRLYFGTYRLYQTNDGATTWKAISLDLTGGGYQTLTAIAVAPGDSNTVYVGTSDGRLQVTTNATAGEGSTWTNSSAGLPNRHITQISVDANNAKTAYVTFSGFTYGKDTQGHVFKTINGGTTWLDISGDLPNIPANDIVIDPDLRDTLYLATDAGVLRTTDGGLTWSPLGIDLPRALVMGLKLHQSSRVLRAATSGRSMWDILVPLASTNPIPSITSLSPSTAIAGTKAFDLTVTGTGFVPGSIVRWNENDRKTTFVNVTTLRASITATDLRATDTVQVMVFNPAPGGGTSAGLNFTINNPLPVLTSLSTSSATAGGAAFRLTVTGSNFVSGCVVRWNGLDRRTKFISSAQLTASIAALDIAVAGSAQVTVFNPAPGGGASASLTFTITSSATPVFTDVPIGYRAYDYTVSIYNAKITHGCGNSKYCPEAIVTREQMAAFIIRALE